MLIRSAQGEELKTECPRELHRDSIAYHPGQVPSCFNSRKGERVGEELQSRRFSRRTGPPPERA